MDTTTPTPEPVSAADLGTNAIVRLATEWNKADQHSKRSHKRIRRENPEIAAALDVLVVAFLAGAEEASRG